VSGDLLPVARREAATMKGSAHGEVGNEGLATVADVEVYFGSGERKGQEEMDGGRVHQWWNSRQRPPEVPNSPMTRNP